MSKAVKVSNFRPHENLKNIRSFFDGLRVSNIKMKNKGNGTVEFRSEKDALEAVNRNLMLHGKREIRVWLSKEVVNETAIKEKKPTFPVKSDQDVKSEILDTGRLYLRNLSYTVTEAEIVDLFKQYGDIVEVHLPFDHVLKRPKGFAFVTFMSPKDAVEAYKSLNHKPFLGMKIHIMAAAEKPDDEKKINKVINYEDEDSQAKNYQIERLEKMKSSSSSAHNWNVLFVNGDTVAQYLADKLEITKSELFNDALKGSISVKLALAETELISKVRAFLVEQHIDVAMLEKITNSGPRVKGKLLVPFALSSTTFIVKNLAPGVTKHDLETIFKKYDGLDSILLPPYGVTAIVTYKSSQQAKVAYQNSAYYLLADNVLFLQWAPVEIFGSKSEITEEEVVGKILVKETKTTKKRKRSELESTASTECKKKKTRVVDDNDKQEVVTPEVVTPEIVRSKKLIVKNLSFQATKKELYEFFGIFNGLENIRMIKKDDREHRGFAFVIFETEDDAQIAKDTVGTGTHLLGRRMAIEYSFT